MTWVQVNLYSLEKLFGVQSQVLQPISDSFYRFLYQKIDWENRLIGIKGPRGSGKTTLLLQRIKFDLKQQNALYVSADHPYFYNHKLYDLAEAFHQLDGRFLLIDEVHKYPNWSRELKSIHDSFPKLSIVFSSSSALDIFKGEADLSRRVAIYELPGMALREFISFKYQIHINPYTLEEMVNHHQEKR